MIQKVSDPSSLAPLFAGWQETILWSCLQGVMGEVYAPAGEGPTAALATLGDFTFLAGQPQGELAAFVPPGRSPAFHLLVPQNEGWCRCIETLYGPRARRITRYATHKDSQAFDRRRLTQLAASLPPGYALRAIDETGYQQCRQAGWSRDLVSQFPTPEAYAALALGFGVFRGDRLLAGASTYARYQEGIEIEVDTHPDHRRQGLATGAAAALILACLDCGLYPSWDAHNTISLSLAQKLGYRFSHPYPAYELSQ